MNALFFFFFFFGGEKRRTSIFLRKSNYEPLKQMKRVLGKRSHVYSGITFTQNFVKNEQLLLEGGRKRKYRKKGSIVLADWVGDLIQNKKEWGNKRRNILALW
jgi:hypothetical protein